MKVEASIGGGPWGPWYEVRSEGDLIVWSVVEGGDERRETVDPGPAGWERFWNAVDAAGVWAWKERYEDPAVLDGTSWSLRLEHGDHLLVDDPDVARDALDRIAEGVEHWADVLAGRPGEPGEIPVTNAAAYNDLDLPAMLLPEIPGASVEGAGLGF